eukprot:g2305.t1
MSTNKFGAPVQDTAPKGGFPNIRVARRIPESRGPPGWALFALAGIAVFGGMAINGGYTNFGRREGKREVLEKRAVILPYLMAEEDERYLNLRAKALAEEKEIMKGVPGWKVGESVYHSKKRWLPPQIHAGQFGGFQGGDFHD